MREHEVGFTLFRPAGPPEHPIDAVIHDEALVELFEESFVETSLGRARRRQHRERHHACHGRMVVEPQEPADGLWGRRSSGGGVRIERSGESRRPWSRSLKKDWTDRMDRRRGWVRKSAERERA